MDELDSDLTLLPNGDLNVPYVVAKAHEWLQLGRLVDAGRAYQRVARQSKSPHLGWYGLGQCLLRGNHPAKAVEAFQRAFAIEPRAYIAEAWVEALLRAGQSVEAERRAREFALRFVGDAETLERFRILHRKSAGH